MQQLYQLRPGGHPIIGPLSSEQPTEMIYSISDCEWSNFKRTTQEHPNTFWIFQLKQSDLTNKNSNIPYRSQASARFVWMQKELIQKFHPHMLYMFLSRVSRRLFAAFLDYSSSLWVDTRLPRHTALSCRKRGGTWTEKNLRCHAGRAQIRIQKTCAHKEIATRTVHPFVSQVSLLLHAP